MSRKRPKFDYHFGDVLEVWWIDAHGDDGTWVHKEDLEDVISPSKCVTVGYYIKTTKHAVALAGSMDETLKEGDDVSGISVIPKGMIERINVIRNNV